MRPRRATCGQRPVGRSTTKVPKWSEGQVPSALAARLEQLTQSIPGNDGMALDGPGASAGGNAEGGVRVTIRDWGTGVNPLSLPPRQRDPLLVQPGDFDIKPEMFNLHLADVNGDSKLDLIYGFSDTSVNTGLFVAGTAIQRGNGIGGSFLDQLAALNNWRTPSQQHS